MKKQMVILALLALLIIPVQSFAQDDDFTPRFGIKAGWAFFTEEPFDEAVENNWIVGADAALWWSNGFGIGIDAKFSTKDQDAEDIDGYNMDFEFTTAPISINGYYKIQEEGSEFVPYFGGGFSAVYADLTAHDFDNGGAEVTADDWAMGFNVVAGIEYGQFFLEGQYIWAEAEFEEFNFVKEDIEDDLNVGGFNVVAGLRF